MEKTGMTRIKKYDKERPAFYNQRLLELKKVEEKSSLYLQMFLRDSKGDLDELEAQLGIQITRHPTMPLLIFNYDHVKTPHDSLIGLECRGLVLEEGSWNVVAKPMNRFFNWAEIDLKNAHHPNFDKSQFDFEDFVTQSKEDGSLVVLYFNKKSNKWMLNTRMYFLNNMEEKYKIRMGFIHELEATELIDTFLKALDPKFKTLDQLGGLLDVNKTYCFEFCSKLNRIVRIYDQDTIFLLAIVDNQNFSESPNKETDEVANKIQAARPTLYSLQSLKEIQVAMKEMIRKDPSLEGFVIRDKKASRWKIKSPSYFFLHHISYDKMRTPFPDDLVPLILQGEGTELFSILEINGFHAELVEVKKQWDFCEKRIKESLATLIQDFDKVKNFKELGELRSVSLKSPVKSLVEELFAENKLKMKFLEEKWCENSKFLVDKLFTEQEKRPPNVRKSEVQIAPIKNFIKDSHLKTNPEDNHLKNIIAQDNFWWKKIEEENNGIARATPHFKDNSWYVECYCGRRMNLYSVPENIFSHKCLKYNNCSHCALKIDKSKFKGKMSSKVTHKILIYQCTCGLAHGAHQKQNHIENERKRRPLKGKPLGIPCSAACLCLRHQVHKEMDLTMNLLRLNKDGIYSECAQILDVNIEDSHVGVLGITQCRKLIEGLREIRGDS